ncbi:hypothetical protein CP061683_0283A, partial [Chlamydia psittaci 06-1683]
MSRKVAANISGFLLSGKRWRK